MRSRTAIIASVIVGASGIGTALMGLMAMSDGTTLRMSGTLVGGGPIELPTLVPLLAVVAGVVLAIAALVLSALRVRAGEPQLAPLAAANAPLIVASHGDEVTFYWCAERGATRRRGTPRAALTHG